ncbi:MAG: N-acetyltransferase [Alphaproteobacteria bacterium]|nr:N-acetyltransferase [Alphaproteobacteria bacterium]
MPFNTPEIPVPEGVQNDEFLLRPIGVTDAALDYEAVMESRVFLRKWEQSNWPADDFTVDENREDLRKLEQRHAARESFAYTMLNPAETQCLGCVYIFSTAATMFTRSKIRSMDGTQWPVRAAALYFWVRKIRLADGLDRRLLEVLGPWMERDWRFGNHLVITNEQFEQQVAMIENAGMQLRFRIDDPKANGHFLAYGNR